MAEALITPKTDCKGALGASPIFYIVTITNDEAQYASLSSSLRDTGFNDHNSILVRLDNSSGNRHDPFTTLRSIGSVSTAPYIVFCHQDVRFNLGHGFSQLYDAVRALDALDGTWAVAGNAGFDLQLRHVFHLDDPYSAWRAGDLPRRVISLDENFLVLRRGSLVPVSEGLSGFHFYASDICLNCHLLRRRAYVIPFLVTHLSGGAPWSESFRSAKEAFRHVWARRIAFGHYITPCTRVFFDNGNVLLRRLSSVSCITDLLLIAEVPLIRKGPGAVGDVALALSRLILNPAAWLRVAGTLSRALRGWTRGGRLGP